MGDQDGQSGAEKKSINLESDIISHSDAILCLRDQIDVLVPFPDIGVCNNLDEYFLKSTISTQRAQQGSDIPLKSSESENHLENTSITFPEQIFVTPQIRNFEKILKKIDAGKVTRNYQLSSSISRKKLDVFSKIEQLGPSSGPLFLLKSKVNTDIEVLIRRRRKVPFISRAIKYRGTLVLFDKHMNLYLKDVIESFKYSRDGKLAVRARHRYDMLVRGDNIISIS